MVNCGCRCAGASAVCGAAQARLSGFCPAADERARCGHAAFSHQALIRAEAREQQTAQAFLNATVAATGSLPDAAQVQCYPAVPMVPQRIANRERGVNAHRKHQPRRLAAPVAANWACCCTSTAHPPSCAGRSTWTSGCLKGCLLFRAVLPIEVLQLFSQSRWKSVHALNSCMGAELIVRQPISWIKIKQRMFIFINSNRGMINSVINRVLYG